VKGFESCYLSSLRAEQSSGGNKTVSKKNVSRRCDQPQIIIKKINEMFCSIFGLIFFRCNQRPGSEALSDDKIENTKLAGNLLGS
jgi:hypothetical protein